MTVTGGTRHEEQWAEPAACLRNCYFFWAPWRCRRLGRVIHPAPMQPDSEWWVMCLILV